MATGFAQSGLFKLAYATGFAVLLPLALAAWAWAGQSAVSAPLPPLWAALSLLGLGAAIYVAGVATFISRTGKLPSNADPPATAVHTGIYRVMSDPIYVGFTLAVFGAVAAAGLGFGFWVVAPVLALSTVALVLGYENHHRPSRAAHPAWLDWPANNAGASGARDRIAAAAYAGLVDMLLAGLAVMLGGEGTPEIAIGSAGAAIVGAVVVMASARSVSKRRLRGYILIHLLGGAASLSTLGLPGAEGAILLAPIGLGSGAAAYCSGNFYAGVIFMAAAVGLAGVYDRLPPNAAYWLAAYGIGAALLPGLHRLAMARAERIANSWSSVSFGRVRLINYAIYPAAAAFVGVAVFNTFAADPTGLHSAIVVACGLVGAGVWGQLMEFSGRLARPFGYFGAVFGSVLGVVVVSLSFDRPLPEVGAALVLCAPWTQAIGRLRCLVQGCCHGRPVHNTADGIRYWRPQSRVVHLAKLAQVPVHPTPLYSIYANLFLGTFLLGLTINETPAALVIAAYLFVAGASRFVEESFRGEPQTPVLFGLKLYQWLAIGQLLAGVLVTLIPSAALPSPSLPSAAGFVVAVIAALVSGFAMGVDFPRSQRRFSRLTPM
jgi:protein-S-isoprenylcysteine O-methyltransferase Ste14